jgi:hypothetical protein
MNRQKDRREAKMKKAAFFLLFAGSIAVSAEAATTIPCVATGVSSPVTVTAPGASAARLYFRKSGTPNFYYVDLKPGLAGFWGMLPRPEKGTSVEYAAEITGAGGATARETAAVVSQTPGCSPALNPDESRLADNLVVGQTTAGDKVPPGFECKGIVSVITPENKLESNSCSNALPYFIGGAAAVAAGVLIYDNNHGHGHGHHVSQSTP